MKADLIKYMKQPPKEIILYDLNKNIATYEKNFLTTCVKLSVLAGIGYGAYLYACAGEGMEDYYYSSAFSPEIAVGNTSYKALFLDEGSFSMEVI